MASVIFSKDDNLNSYLENIDGSVYELDGASSFFDKKNNVITVTTKENIQISIKPQAIDTSLATDEITDSESIFRWVSKEYVKKNDNLKSLFLTVVCSEANGFSLSPTTGGTIFSLSTKNGAYTAKDGEILNIHGFRISGRNVFLDMSDPIALLKFAELRLYFRDNEDELYVNEALSKLDNVPWGSEANNGDFSSQLNGSTGSPSFLYPQDCNKWINFSKPLMNIGRIDIAGLLEYPVDPQGNNAFTFVVELSYTEG
ncbi:hypothetical protein [Roseivirga spongicola]|uniref:Uncharacterized protein n=1 Tax=Roseivirga spongicola TaxID=333140 RepID=A0A150XCK0_9BACT|nr:hypothetical protein [Roseivirga spongicola]KYG76394.1 hypothetical protein AWW68_19590 [Roseivirga spongicola]WPZ08770.1 hypothetical protein T7867_10925 [Roseivirga spongicola]